MKNYHKEELWSLRKYLLVKRSGCSIETLGWLLKFDEHFWEKILTMTMISQQKQLVTPADWSYFTFLPTNICELGQCTRDPKRLAPSRAVCVSTVQYVSRKRPHSTVCALRYLAVSHVSRKLVPYMSTLPNGERSCIYARQLHSLDTRVLSLGLFHRMGWSSFVQSSTS